MIIEHVNPFSLRSLLLFAPIFVLCGCGQSEPRRYAIKGTVKLNGQPVNHATLILTPTDEGLAAAATIQNGAFELPQDVGPSAGRFNVRVNPNEVEIEAVSDSAQLPRATARPRIPSVYQRDGVLFAEVTGKPNQTLDFELKSR